MASHIYVLFCVMIISAVAAVAVVRSAKQMSVVLSLIAVVMMVILWPTDIFRGFTVSTFLGSIPAMLACWTLSQAVSRKSKRDFRPTRYSYSLRTVGVAIASISISLAIMSHAKFQYKNPRDLSGRCVHDELAHAGIGNVVLTATSLTGHVPPPQPPRILSAEITRNAFDPPVILMRPGDSLTIRNKSSVAHNLYIHNVFNLAINSIVLPGDEITFSPSVEERFPVTIRDNIHPWLRAFICVTNSYAAVSHDDGNWTMPSVLPGEYKLRIWHAERGFVKKTTLKNGILRPTRRYYAMSIGKRTLDIGNLLIKDID